MAVSVPGDSRKGPGVTAVDLEGDHVGPCIASPDHGGVGHLAVHDAHPECLGGLTAGVTAFVPVVVAVIRAGVLQTCREGAAGVGELLVETVGEEPVEFQHGRPSHRCGRHGEQDQQPRGETGAQGAASRPPHRCAGLRTYPVPRTVWIIGARPESIFLRRYEMYSSTTCAWPPKS